MERRRVTGVLWTLLEEYLLEPHALIPDKHSVTLLLGDQHGIQALEVRHKADREQSVARDLLDRVAVESQSFE